MWLRSEEEVLELRHVNVALIFRVFNQFFFLDEASDNCVCALGLFCNLRGASSVVVIHSVNLWNEHLSCGGLLPSELITRFILRITRVSSLNILTLTRKWPTTLFSYHSLFVHRKIVVSINQLWWFVHRRFRILISSSSCGFSLFSLLFSHERFHLGHLLRLFIFCLRLNRCLFHTCRSVLYRRLFLRGWLYLLGFLFC